MTCLVFIRRIKTINQPSNLSSGFTVARRREVDPHENKSDPDISQQVFQRHIQALNPSLTAARRQPIPPLRHITSLTFLRHQYSPPAASSADRSMGRPLPPGSMSDGTRSGTLVISLIQFCGRVRRVQRDEADAGRGRKCRTDGKSHLTGFASPEFSASFSDKVINVVHKLQIRGIVSV